MWGLIPRRAAAAGGRRSGKLWPDLRMRGANPKMQRCNSNLSAPTGAVVARFSSMGDHAVHLIAEAGRARGWGERQLKSAEGRSGP
jgi:hypothetical protein